MKSTWIFFPHSFHVKSLSEANQNDDLNVVLSPFSIWSVMLLVAEGASGQSFDQLKQALHLSNDLTESQAIYKNIEKLLSTNRSGIELAVNQAMFTDSKYQLQPEYVDTLVNQYEANFLSVDFQQQGETAQTINNYLSNRTNGQINSVVNPDDLTETTLVLTSMMHFEGKWKVSSSIEYVIFSFQTIFVVLCSSPLTVNKPSRRNFSVKMVN